MKLLLLGSYGNLGQEILKLIVDRRDIEITVLGRNKKLLQHQVTEYPNINYICEDIENFDSFADFDLVINCTCTLNFQEKLIKKIDQSNVDFFDCHSPCKTNYELYEKYNLTSNTFLFDCGATSFLPFLSLLDEFNELSVVAHFTTYWQNKNLSEKLLSEFLQIQDENKELPCVLENRKWYNKVSKKDDMDPIPNIELILLQQRIPTIKNLAYYLKMDNANDSQTESATIYILTESQKLTVISKSGYYLTAAMVTSALFNHLKNSKSGSYIMGDYVDPKSFIKSLEKLGIQFILE